MNPLYPPVAHRAAYRCEYCRAPEVIFSDAFEVEHIAPKGRGGSNLLENLALACSACNSYKGVFETGYDEATATEVSIFHPRRESWNDHFQFEWESGKIIGLTPAGRATVNRLQMNLPRHITARLLWVKLDYYP